MEDIEIYQLAKDVIDAVTSDLNQSIYKELNGKLHVVWGTKSSFNASAIVLNKSSEPPNHQICLNYELIRKMYRDTEHYHEFAENIDSQKSILLALNSITEIPMLPECFSKKDSITNMFIASLTFVFFHELGHLMQRHGEIRAVYNGYFESNYVINECDINDSVKLTDKQAAVSHTTELAADFSAITRCIFELMRHFSDEKIVGKDHKGIELMGAIYLLVSGLASVFYRFRGIESLDLEEIPIGSHPPPITRLELNLPHIYEMLDLPAIKEISGHNLDREKLVKLVSRAAYSGAFFWLVRTGDREKGIPENYLFKGIVNVDKSKKYTKRIIETWDEIEPIIDKLILEDFPFSKMTFTKQIRDLVK